MLLPLVTALAVASAPVVLPPTADVMKELERIEAAGYHNGADAIRIKYQDEARARPGDPMPRVYMAWCSLPSDDAWNQLKAISQIHPDNPWVHYGMGRIYVSWKMRDLAKTSFDTALKRDAQFFPAMTGLGDLARLQENWPLAEQQYRAALAIAPEDPFARAGLGLALLAQGKKDEARVELRKATSKYPELPQALAAVVKLSIEAKDPTAIESATQLADLRPKDRDARRTLAELRLEAGDKAGAVKEYERLMRLGNLEIPVLERVAGLYRELNDADGEERTLTNLAVLDEKNPAPNMRLAELKLAKKDLEGAEGQLLEVLARDPKRADAQLELAKCKIERGVPHEALEHLRAAAAIDSSNADTKAQIVKLEADFKLPKAQAKGNANNIFWSVASSLDKFYAERRAAKPALAGKMKIRVRIAADGRVEGVDVLDDAVKDSLLLGHVYFRLRDAAFPKGKAEPIFEFEVGGKKK